MIYTTPETVPTLNVYTTRSGRSIRRVERYEPDEDTIFIDQDSYDSDDESENCSEIDSVLPIDISDGEQDDDEYESSSEEEIDSSDDESLSGTTVSSILGEDEEDADALNWDTLTIDASDDESDEEEEFDDDEEDAI